MAERTESSVLFALGELRDIEHDRVRRAEAEAARVEAERRAEAQRIAKERDRLAAERAEMDRRREEQRQFELELAERRARIEAQMKLEEQRIAIEARTALPADTSVRPSTSPWLWAALTIVAIALAGMQWMQWQVQKDLDASLASLRSEIEKPGFIPIEAPDEPTPAAIADKVTDTAAATDTATATDTAPAAATATAPSTHRPPRKPPRTVDEGVTCDDVEDPLGCLPAQK